MIRLTIPSIDENDLQAVREALASGYLVQGARVAAFEKKVADYVGTKHAIAVSNCTAALHLSLLAVNVKPGDYVVVTSYSWIATANVIELCGAQPIFIDIQPDTFNINPESLLETLNHIMKNAAKSKRVKALLPVHTFGQMANMTAIMEIAQQYDLPVIEDAACALGAKWQGKQAGTWGTIGCFSFHPLKAITTGEGGIVTTNDEKIAECIRTLRNHGQDFSASSRDFILPGYNYRLTEIQAALGQAQMTKLDQLISKRRQLASKYDELLAGTNILAPANPPDSWHVYQSYVALLPEQIAKIRQNLIVDLKKQGIETNIGTIHMPLTSYYRNKYDYRLGNFPVTDSVANRSLTLPLYHTLSETDQEVVVENIRELAR